MTKKTLPLLAAVGSLAFTVPSVSAKTLTESLQQGSIVKVNFRTRYEDVTEDVLGTDTDREADAFTMRSRLSYQSGSWNGFGFSAEFDNVSELTNDVDYRTSNAASDPLAAQSNTVAIIGDPVGTEVNQGFISYSDANNQVRYGRQRLVLDNARFIGNSGWRQNEQTYDGISWVNKSVHHTNFTYAYVKNVNRPAGENNPTLGDLHTDTHIVNASFTGISGVKLIGYAYLIDINDPVGLKGFNGDTFGARWQGTVGSSFLYNIEYAIQQDAGAAKLFEADYSLIEATYNLGNFSATLALESLGSDEGRYGFATPLGTLHGVQGWADKFGSTPAAGLKDAYVNLGLTVAGAQALVNYHKYDAIEGSFDFGSEIGFSLSKKIGATVWTAKYAQYSAGDVSANHTDTNKLWLQADWNF